MSPSKDTEARRIANLQRDREREAVDRARDDARPEGGERRAEAQVLDTDLARERQRSDETLEAERLDSDRQLAEMTSQFVEVDAARARAVGQVATREQLLAIVSHDLKNPLNTILLGLATLVPAFGSEATPPIQAALGRMRRAARTMDRMIADLLDSERLAAGFLQLRLETHDVSEVVRDAMEAGVVAAEAKAIAIVADAPETPVPAVFDSARLLQVLGNLIDNAIKHTPPGGRVTIGYRAEAQAVRLWVEDTGPGISETERESVFERFSQLGRGDRQSIGLGLFICRRLVEAHAGRITAEAAPGGGASFVITLPLLVAPTP